MNKCDICGNEHSESTRSCAPCQKIISKHDKLTTSKLRDALRAACDKEKSTGDERYFKCFYTGIMSKFNPTTEAGLDPLIHALVLTIDHENPEDPNSRLVVSLNHKEIEQEDFENKFKQLLVVSNTPKSNY
jgi:hypothetical protein